MTSRVKIYDFDKTLISTDSIAVLCKYLIDKKIYTRSRVYGIIARGLIRYIKTGNIERIKDGFARLTYNMTDEQLNDFVDILLDSYGYKNLIADIREDGYITILCSASLESYIKIVSERLGFDYFIGTSCDANGVVGKNNSREEKASRLKVLFDKENITVDKAMSKSYTDSYKNDKWMCSFTDNKFLVNCNKKINGFINIEGKSKQTR